METFHVYKDIRARTNGEIYIGVVGPVRTGKSTFIKRFMDLMVLPNMEDEYEKRRTRDELPQSSAGKTIMTTEPKFVPNEAIEIVVEDDIQLKVRLIDCVGYMVEGAVGHLEENQERLVKTPWFDYEIPFTKAASIGTKKVIEEHSTIGFVITTDGSFGEIPRGQYEPVETQTIEELKALHKPFVVILNSSHPYSNETKDLAEQIRKKHQCPVLALNCEQLKKEDINELLKTILLEFPITSIGFYTPKWMEALSQEHMLKKALLSTIRENLAQFEVMRDLYQLQMKDNEYIQKMKIDAIHLDTGEVDVSVIFDDQYYYQIISDFIGIPVNNEYEFLKTIQVLAKTQKECEQVAEALTGVRQKGYGVVSPLKKDISLEEPQLVKHGNKYGIRIKAQAPSIHMIRANISTEIAPIVGTKEQAQDIIDYMKAGASKEEGSIWDINLFGKTLEEMVGEGMQAKAAKMNDESQLKLQNTMEKIVNESNGGLVCIII
ncbi:MAG: stage IV sporulation protein A [Lachnospiraceae bacterium]|nr:stage IV sporulation protein A [Lachnospiraceae bacterium]